MSDAKQNNKVRTLNINLNRINFNNSLIKQI